MPRFRLAQAGDLDAFYSISLATGLAGSDAAHLYEDGMLMGHIYRRPMPALRPILLLSPKTTPGLLDLWSARQTPSVGTRGWNASGGSLGYNSSPRADADKHRAGVSGACTSEFAASAAPS
jgi:hypothetical protein